MTAQPAVRTRLLDLGLEPVASRTPEELSNSLSADYQRDGAVLKSMDFKPE
ncbi:hypothetical protein [Variovorax rhizosphaerae]|uniref:Uncharacterized protein n=1 Tax=Variovorax rhizosphaerae TaxID=1836200 RepID=A0ABU8WJQ8_9BURK